MFSDVNMAIHSSGENGNKNASNGISDLVCGAANNETPLWKYGALKSITSARALGNKKNENGERERKNVTSMIQYIEGL